MLPEAISDRRLIQALLVAELIVEPDPADILGEPMVIRDRRQVWRGIAVECFIAAQISLQKNDPIEHIYGGAPPFDNLTKTPFAFEMAVRHNGYSCIP
jgi:hypothetical protein